MIRRFEEYNAQEVSDLIAKTLRETNINDYSVEYIENDVKSLTAEYLLERSKCTHSYVVCEVNKLIGCGSMCFK